MKHAIERTKPPARHQREGSGSYNVQTAPTSILLCAIAFTACILISLAPLDRLAGTDYFRSLPLGTWLLAIGTWLPLDLHLADTIKQSQMSTHLILFLALMALAFVIYGAGAWCIQRYARHPTQNSRPRIMRWIWAAAVISGIALVFTPAMLSHDAFVYAGYGRLLAVYHENPYFVTLSTHPQDPFTRLDEWSSAPAAYGPVWLIVSALGTFIAGDNPLASILLYRLLGLGMHLLNIVLVSKILRASGQTEQTVALGTLLYAWNPLMLLESSLGAHMDTVMVTLMLGGILSWIHKERKLTNHIPGIHAYLPALLCFTAAALIKFTTIPLPALFLVLLARRTFDAAPESSEKRGYRQWSLVIRTVVTGGVISVACAIALYAPFWIGYSPQAIIESFIHPPSANSAYGSILSAILNWIRWRGQANPGWQETPLFLFSQHKTWQNITMIALILVMICGVIWIWKRPTIRTLSLATLAALGTLLVVTPWFFPWYVTWLVGTAATCLPMSDRPGRALIGAALVFSGSAFFIHLFRGFPPIGDWEGFTSLTTVGPPLLTLIILFILPQRRLTRRSKLTAL